MESSFTVDVVIEEGGDHGSEARNQALYDALRAGLPGHFLRIQERALSQVNLSLSLPPPHLFLSGNSSGTPLGEKKMKCLVLGGA